MAADKEWDYNFTSVEWEACIKVLENLKESPNQVPDLDLIKGLISKIYKNARKERRTETKSQRRQEDLATIGQTYTFNYQAGLSEHLSNITPGHLHVHKPMACYACGTSYHEINPIYHRLCPDCALLHIAKKQQSADLSGRIAVVTGGRIKVGYATALKLLRDGATVIVTTRFPHDALYAFSQENDFSSWEHRLLVYGLDLRNIKSIDAFIDYLFAEFTSLDILVNNAAQTIKYDAQYYQQLVQREQESALLLPAGQTNIRSAAALPGEFVPIPLPGNHHTWIETDIFNQPIDKRDHNSWTAKLAEIDTVELLEVNLVNNIAPFILTSRLKPLLEKSGFPDRFVINVTSSEGQFSYSNKTIFHPHTNMTKAALNMMTRTSATDFAASRIYMNSVDVGWVSTGNPIEKKQRLATQGHVMPLDIHDAAARIYDPVVKALNSGVALWGKLFKNYTAVDW